MGKKEEELRQIALLFILFLLSVFSQRFPEIIFLTPSDHLAFSQSAVLDPALLTPSFLSIAQLFEFCIEHRSAPHIQPFHIQDSAVLCGLVVAFLGWLHRCRIFCVVVHVAAPCAYSARILL